MCRRQQFDVTLQMNGKIWISAITCPHQATTPCSSTGAAAADTDSGRPPTWPRLSFAWLWWKMIIVPFCFPLLYSAGKRNSTKNIVSLYLQCNVYPWLYFRQTSTLTWSTTSVRTEISQQLLDWFKLDCIFSSRSHPSLQGSSKPHAHAIPMSTIVCPMFIFFWL